MFYPHFKLRILVLCFFLQLGAQCLCHNLSRQMAKSTSTILKNLRACMLDVNHVENPIQAYIVPTDDAHQSEYIAPCDARRSYISGFTGSAGTAVVTHDDARLWTDGRYYLQAEREMDSNWHLMKEGLPTTPNIAAWLVKTLPAGSRVGVDGNLYSYRAWKPLETELEAAGHYLVPIKENLVDLIWENRPSRPCESLHVLGLQFTGKSCGEKITEIREKMVEKHVSYLVITALDEIAWLLNLRGQDIMYNPVFFSYIVLTPESVNLFIDSKKITEEILEHFTAQNLVVNIFKYEDFHKYLEDNKECIQIKNKIWVSSTSGYAVSAIFPETCRVTEITPIPVMKALKNPTEIQGMKNAHIKDGAALACFFAWLERQVLDGALVTEVSAAAKLVQFRSLQEDFMGPSFETISAVGPHGSIIHFKPSAEDDTPITDKELYLCDSGAQFRDGTTDITRTMHFGTPTDYEKECFTRVFKGQTLLGTTVFPLKIQGNTLDSFARKFLWDVGLDYGHGTGHGIGAFLNVHEGPMGVTWRPMPDDPGLQEGMFLSNEPGYYEDGKFGIRIEDIVEVVKANTPHNHNQRGFLTFNRISLCPIQTKMLVRSMLTESEIKTLNEYHQQCRDIVGPLLDQQGHSEAKQWLMRETKLF